MNRRARRTQQMTRSWQKVIIGVALVLAAGSARAVSVPLGSASGGVGVYYNDNGGGENPANVAYLHAQFSYANTNGAELNFDSTPLAGTGGAVSFYSLFQAVPNQFGLDLTLKAPTWDGSVAVPVLNAKENVNGTVAGATNAGPVTWA